MSFWRGHYIHYCHWCNKRYESTKPIETSRFCSARCKQAHYRAYKKYVTAKTISRAAAGERRVTHKTRATSRTTQGKKQKKWGCAYCNIENSASAKICINCKKPKKVGAPFSLSV